MSMVIKYILIVGHVVHPDQTRDFAGGLQHLLASSIRRRQCIIAWTSEVDDSNSYCYKGGWKG